MGREQLKTPKMIALELSAKRDAISTEMEDIASILTAPGGPGLAGNLVDAEGFPREDVDIASIRAQRNRLSMLRNDYKEVSTALEAALQAALPPLSSSGDGTAQSAPSITPRVVRSEPSSAAVTTNGASSGSAASSNGATVALRGHPGDRARTPFAIVASVAPGSPAADAELMVDDRVAAFGAISLHNLHSTSAAMSALPGTVRSHVNRPIEIIVHRGSPEAFNCLTLSITPRPWGGAGMLGCHVRPLLAEEDRRYRPEVVTAVARR